MFVHLRLHTEFSVVDGTCRIDDAIKAAAADGQPAMAITDLNNMFGGLKFNKSGRGKGVKPILGAELIMEGEGGAPGPRVLVLVQSKLGYHNLSEILARGWTGNVPRGQAQALSKWEWLQELGEGLILLSGANAGPVGQALQRGDKDGAAREALRMASLFPHRFYLELQRAGRPEDESLVVQTVQLAARLNLPVVATHPVQFFKPGDFESHEARVCIAEGEVLGNTKRVKRFTREQYLKSSAEMQALFADVPSALENTVEIARRCSVTLLLGKNFLPDFPTPNGMPAEDYFRHASYEGLEERLQLLFPNEAKRQAARPQYVERLEFELGIILKMGFPGYFLIVADFINWAKNNGCPVGPGRGSGAGSLVAYVLKITDLDPIHYNLLFERFLNPERVSMPDFDVDFCQANRDRVIDYVKDRYGRNAVSQIATFGTMAARAAIRDVGRVLDLSYNFCDGISKLVPNKPGLHVTLKYPPNPRKENDKYTYAVDEQALAERLEKEEDVKMLIEMAQKLEGMCRNIGMHAGGVVIAPGKLTDFCPLYQQPGSDSAVAMYDKDDVEQIGLVKFDFLGLATLTILEIAREFIMKRHKGQENFKFEEIPLDDYPTYKLFQEGKTEAVFQFESRGMQGMLRDAKPSRLEDLIALNALYRPGPMDLIPSFVARKHGREEIEYPHPLVEQVLAETYGIMVYQEQVMQTAQVLGGYSLGGADVLRRAMGKKKVEEMVKHRGIFREGAAKKGISQDKADEVFDLMEKFAGYGFNKSHAAAYSLLAYHTGWLKVHYTAEFFCGNMTVEMDDTDKLKVLFEDARKNFKMEFEPPNINRGRYRFEPVTNTVIRYGLGAVKGTGQQAIEAIVAAREGRGEGPQGTTCGPFTSLFDFCVRVDRSKINKRTVDALIKAGAFDSLDQHRAALSASLDRAFDFSTATLANVNQGGLFDMMGDDAHGSSTQEPDLVDVPPWGVRERLMFEKSALGFYLSGHLFDESAREVGRFVRTRLDELSEGRETQTVAGIVSDFRVVNGQRGRQGIFQLDDGAGRVEASASEAVITAFRDQLKDDELVIISGRLQPGRNGFEARFIVQQVMDLATARCRFGKYLRVAVGDKPPEVARLLREFSPRRESTEQGELQHGLRVRLGVRCIAGGQGATAELQLSEAHRTYPTDAALAAWRAQAAGGDAVVVYE